MKELLSWLIKNVFQIAGACFLMGSLYLSSKLFPITQRQDRLQYDIDSIKKRNAELEPLIPRFYTVEANEKTTSEKLEDISDDIKSIKEDIADLKNVEGKVDTIIDLIQEDT